MSTLYKKDNEMSSGKTLQCTPYIFWSYLPVLERLCYTKDDCGVWESKEATSTTTLTLINEYFDLYL